MMKPPNAPSWHASSARCDPVSNQHRVIFDTDIGTDVDDILALGVLLGSTDVTIEGITTVYGDVDLRTQIVRKVLQLRGREDTPVHKGLGSPLLRREPIFWPGHEGVGLIDDDEKAHQGEATAIRFLVDHVRAHPGEITLLAVGPLTNIATAASMDPEFLGRLKRLVIMGGRIVTCATSGGVAEHNIKCDPEAAHIVFSQARNIELVPLDVTQRAFIRQDDVDQLHAVDTPYHHALADQVSRYPGFVNRGGSTYLHDPLAAMAIINPDLLSWEAFDVQVELDGSMTHAMTVALQPESTREANARVAMDIDVDRSERWIMDHLSR